MKSVLFVCLGNICRSPMAELVFREMVKAEGVAQEWEIDSAGTAAYHVGEKPDSRSVAECKRRFGPSLSVTHKARRVAKEDFSRFDYILCMDKSNYEDLLDMSPKNPKAVIKMLGSFDPEGKLEVDDPYYIGGSAFADNFDHITRCCRAFIQSVNDS